VRRPEPRKAAGRDAPDPFHLATLALLVIVAVWLLLPLAWLCAQAPRGYSEGWNALVALRAVGDLPLYPQDQTLHSNNYPPLSFYLVGGLGALIGDNVVAGRLVSLTALIAVAAEIALAVRLLGGTWWVAAFAGLLFVPGAMGLDHRTVGGNEPHLLAHAVMLAGLLVLLKSPGSARHVAGAALLMVAGGLIRHNLLGLPLAVTLWLLLRDRRALRTWLLAAGAAVAAALGLLWLAYGAAVFDNILGARSYGLGRLRRLTRHGLENLQILLAASLVLVALQPRAPGPQLAGLFVGCALLLASLQMGGAGTGLNLFFEPLIACCLAAGLLLQQAGRWVRPDLVRPAAVRAALAAALIFGVGLHLPGDSIRILAGPSPVRRAEAVTRADLAFLAAIEGRVMCETLALCYWAGKGLEVDSFNARQGFLARGHDEQVLLDLLANGELAAVQLTSAAPTRDDERISAAFMDSLLRHYRLARVSDNGAFFVYDTGARPPD
jgi:6-pyruvoyl-tetrahydropterin synthase related domain